MLKESEFDPDLFEKLYCSITVTKERRFRSTGRYLKKRISLVIAILKKKYEKTKETQYGGASFVLEKMQKEIREDDFF